MNRPWTSRCEMAPSSLNQRLDEVAACRSLRMTRVIYLPDIDHQALAVRDHIPYG